MEAFANFNFNDSTSGTGVTGPALMTGGWRTYVPHGNGIYEPSLNADGTTNLDYLPGGKFGLGCAATGGCTKSQAFPLAPDWNYLMDNRPRPEEDAHISRTFWWFPKRGSTSTRQMYQFVVGVEGDLPSLNWTWEAYASYGEAHTLGVYSGMMSLERYRYVTRQPNFGRNMYVQGNPLAGNFAAATSRCTSGLPMVWGVSGYGPDFVVSDDCIDAISSNTKMTGEMGQTVAEFNLQGPIVDMPAGELQFAVGASYRENTLLWLADTLNHNQGFLDQVGGAHPLGDADGRTKSNDVYGELVVPLINDKPGLQQVNLELGYRYSHRVPGRERRLVQGFDRLVGYRQSAASRRQADREPCAEHRRAVPVSRAVGAILELRRLVLAEKPRERPRAEPGRQQERRGGRRGGAHVV